MKDKNTTLSELKRSVDQFIKERNWQKHQSPKNIAVSLSIEAAELLENFQWDTIQQSRKKLEDPEQRDKIRYEIADVLYYLLDLANQFDLDITETFFEKLEKTRAKFPKGQKLNREKYWKIKEEYRRSGK